MDITDRSDKKLTVVDLNNLVLKDNIFVYEGMVFTYVGTTSVTKEVKVLVSITEGNYFMNETEHFFAAVTSEAVTQAIATNGTYYLWIGIDSTDSVISYLTDTYVSPTYTEESELLVNCLKVTVTGTYTTTIDETIDLKIVNNYYGQGVESGLLDSFMKNNIKIVEQQAENTLTPTSFEDMVIDTFSDTTGYLNTVVTGSTTATFDTDKYERATTIDDEITCLITGVTIAKTHCQLYINQIDNEPDCEITYDIISADAESDTDIAINSYHEITSFTPTVAKLTNAKIVMHLKNDAVAPTSGYPSIKSYVLKLW